MMLKHILAASLIVAVAMSAAAAADVGQRPQGGANQRSAVEGCMGQWLFNGVWRLRVTSVTPYEVSSQPGYAVAVEVRNGTRKTLELGNTGVAGRGQGVDLVTSDGDSLTLDDLDYQRLGYKDVAQAGQASRKLLYHFAPGTQDVASKKPAKFIMAFDKAAAKAVGQVHYSLPDPSFRVNLTCTKGAS